MQLQKKRNEYPNIKMYGFKQDQIAHWMGYNSVRTLQTSTRYRQILQGIEDILKEANSINAKHFQP